MSKTARRKKEHTAYSDYKPFMETYDSNKYVQCTRKLGRWKHEKEALAHRHPDTMHFRAYKCEHCGWYHLTSQQRPARP